MTWKKRKKCWQLFFVQSIKKRARERGWGWWGWWGGRHFWPQLINRTLFRLACTYYLFTGAFSQSEGNMFQHLVGGEGGGSGREKEGWWWKEREREEVGWTLARCRSLPWRFIRRLHCGSTDSSVTECQREGVFAVEKAALKWAQTSLHPPTRPTLQECIEWGPVCVTYDWQGQFVVRHSLLAFSVKYASSMLTDTDHRAGFKTRLDNSWYAVRKYS